jgi:hypothetical protein
VTRDCHAGICGSRRVKLPPATRRGGCQFSNKMSSSQFQCRRDLINDVKLRIGANGGVGDAVGSHPTCRCLTNLARFTGVSLSRSTAPQSPHKA